jgi:hypothetical protein
MMDLAWRKAVVASHRASHDCRIDSDSKEGFMKLAVAIGTVLMISVGPLCAQESIGGKYSGGYMVRVNQGDQRVSLMLEILSVEGGKVTAKALRGAVGNAGPGLICAGEYQMVGTYENNTLRIKSVSGPGGGDCRLGFILVAEGNKLKGTVGKFEVELSK